MENAYKDFQSLDEDEEHGWKKGIYNNTHTFLASTTNRSTRIRLGLSIGLTVLFVVIIITTVAVSNSNLQNKMKKTEDMFSNHSLSIQSELQLMQSQDKKNQEKLQELENFIKEHASQLTDYKKDREKLKEIDDHVKELEIRLTDSLSHLTQETSKLKMSFSEMNCDLAKLKSNGTLTTCCPVNWVQYSGSCYFISTSTKSWEEAKEFCISKDSILVVINTDEEQEFVSSKTIPQYTWIGLTDSSGEWKWIDGSDYASGPKFWIPGQPDDFYGHGLGGGEDCAHLHSDGRWNDEHCSRPYRWVCEKEASH